MRRVQQAAYPMVKLTQAEIAAMIGRREERRRLAEVRQVHPLISWSRFLNLYRSEIIRGRTDPDLKINKQKN
jgi:hypothetical protein